MSSLGTSLLRYRSYLSIFYGLSWLTIGVVAQQSSFQWGFNDVCLLLLATQLNIDLLFQWTSTTLPQCQPLALFVNEKIGTVKPSPPYYLVAYELGGSNTVNYVGNQVGSLSWAVNHPAGICIALGASLHFLQVEQVHNWFYP